MHIAGKTYLFVGAAKGAGARLRGLIIIIIIILIICL